MELMSLMFGPRSVKTVDKEVHFSFLVRLEEQTKITFSLCITHNDLTDNHFPAYLTRYVFTLVNTSHSID